MELTEIASITGKGGLFKVLKPGKSGVLLESMDAAKTRIVASATQRLSLLSEISIYTTTKEGTAPLDEVLKKINQEYKNDLGVDANSDGSELKAFLKSVLPTFDENRVYVSDIKKLVKWYGILLEQAPEVFIEQKKEA
jgi:Fe2+ transport system protein B